MVAKLVFEYYSGGWVPFAAKLDSISEIRNDHEEATIQLVNDSGNRTFVGADKTVRISYDTHVLFTGLLSAIEYSASTLKCILYNAVYEAMKAKTFTADYSTSGEAADVIFAAVCAAAGVTAGVCPSTVIKPRFDDATCYDAAALLAKSLNTDFYSSSTNTFNIGDRGSLKTITHYRVSNRAVDRSKKRDFVRVIGVNYSGLKIVGEAGTGTNIAVYREKSASDVVSLTAMAQAYLDDLNKDSKTIPISIPIAEGYDLHPGDTLALSNARYAISGIYPIMRLTKKNTTVSAELDSLKPSLAEKLAAISDYAKLDISGSAVYPVQPSQITPWALSITGLVGLFHLTDGTIDPTTIIAADSSISGKDGAITNGYWNVSSAIPGTRFLSFNEDGNVSIPDPFPVGALGAIAIGIWFSPDGHFADGNYLIYRPDQFYLQHYGTDDRVRFGVKIGGTWHTVTSDAGVAPLGSRNFAIGSYDGATLTLYLQGVLAKTSGSVTGNLDASASNVYIGHVSKAAVAEAMLWCRSVIAQEAHELYFFPLLRIIKKGTSGPPHWLCSVDVNNTTWGSTDPSGITALAVGEDLVATAYPVTNAVFKWWRYDGVDNYSTANPITIAAEAVDTNHSLLAVIGGPVGIGQPIIGRIQGIVNAKIISPVLGSMATIVSVTPYAANKWLLDCAYSNLATISPAGLQVVVSGATQAVTATANTAAGYVMYAPFKLDNGGGVGAIDSSGTASYTVPAQTDNTFHQIVAIAVIGWACTGSGTTADYSSSVGSGLTKVYTRSSNPDGTHHSVWKLDGNVVGGNTSTYTVPAQTNGTYHIIAHTIVAN
jgi:hypothetical protein